MSWLLFLDESGHDHRTMPYEVRGGVALHASELWPFVQDMRHPAGDAALVASASVFKTAHEGALCCRYGGEEFVLLLEGMDNGQALAVAEQVRQRIEALPFEHDGARIPLTLSAGVASYPAVLAKTAAELILFADEALYEAKRRGRNRVLLDVGQGRYQDVEGNVFQSDESPKTSEPPRIFA